MSHHPIEVIAANLKRKRAKANLSLSEVAKRANIGKSTLSQLEAGQANPSIETLWSLCVALDITFAELISQPQPEEPRIIRFGEGLKMEAEYAQYQAVLLATCPSERKHDLYLITANPGSTRYSEPHNSGTLEHYVVVQGQARIGPTENPTVLNPGDYISYRADQPHVFEALTDQTCAMLMIEK